MASRVAIQTSAKIGDDNVARMLLARYWEKRSEGISNAARRSTLQSTARIRIGFVGRNSRAASKIAAIQRVMPAAVEYIPASKPAKMPAQAISTYRLRAFRSALCPGDFWVVVAKLPISWKVFPKDNFSQGSRSLRPPNKIGEVNPPSQEGQ